MKDLLVTISHHSAPDRLPYLRRVLEEFATYELSLDIIVDTHICDLDVRGENITVVAHPDLQHPFFLAWCHRKHMRAAIDRYKWFLYIENDLLLSFENFQNYQENFALLWPNCIPSLLRVEEFEGSEYALDVTERQQCTLIHVGGQRSFTTLKEPYHGLWAMPKRELKETMPSDFDRLSDSREVAASFPMWELNKTPLLQMDGKQVNRKCIVSHLSNNYAPCPTSPYGKLKVSEIFK